MAHHSTSAISSLGTNQKARVGTRRIRNGNTFQYARLVGNSGGNLSYGTVVFHAYSSDKKPLNVDLAGLGNVQLWHMAGVATGNSIEAPEQTDATITNAGYAWVCREGYLSSGIWVSGAVLALSSLKGSSGSIFAVSDTIASGQPTYQRHIVAEQANTDAATRISGWVHCDL